MPSKFKPYNKRNFLTIDGKEELRERCALGLLEGKIEGHPDIEISSNRAYRRMPDGSIRRISNQEIKEMLKQEVRIERKVTNAHS